MKRFLLIVWTLIPVMFVTFQPEPYWSGYQSLWTWIRPALDSIYAASVAACPRGSAGEAGCTFVYGAVMALLTLLPSAPVFVVWVFGGSIIARLTGEQRMTTQGDNPTP